MTNYSMIQTLDNYRTYLTIHSIHFGTNETYLSIHRYIKRNLEKVNEDALFLYERSMEDRSFNTDALLDSIEVAINHLHRVENRKEVTS